MEAVEWAPKLFAATVPMAAGTPWGIYKPTEKQAAVFKNVDVAMMFTTSEFDLGGAFDQAAYTLGAGYQEVIAPLCGIQRTGNADL